MELYLVIYLVIASYFPIFKMAGRPQWEAFVPGYNLFIVLRILKRPWWWMLLFVFLGVNVLMLMIVSVNLAKAIGKTKFVEHLAAIFFPFAYFPYVGFSDKEAKWLGPPERDKKQKRSQWREWGDAILFAVVAASIIRGYFIEAFTIPSSSMEKTQLVGDFLFVSKLSYGPKIPQTPLSFPFAHHTMPDRIGAVPLPIPANTPSYLEWVHLDYHRLPGFGDVERNDVVVFNYPEGDTVIVDAQDQGFGAYVRQVAFQLQRNSGTSQPLEAFVNQAHKAVLQQKEYTVRPVDKRENYIKRCVAISGDKIFIEDGELFINDEPAFVPPEMQYKYEVYTKQPFSSKILKERYNVSHQDYSSAQLSLSQEHMKQHPHNMVLPLTNEMAEELRALPAVDSVVRNITPKGQFPTRHIFPNSPSYDWSEDNFGPLVVPQAGETVTLTAETMPLYRRIITIYEGNELVEKDGKFIINGVETNSYTFKMDYYFMMGDNRHNSADSRFWGFVPEDHIVGKAQFVWLSYDPELGWFDGMFRWNRFFSGIE